MTLLHVGQHGKASNPGTADEPLDSLNSAAKKLPEGGLVILHEGLYGPQRLTDVDNITIEVRGRAVIDGGLGDIVDACYLENFDVDVTEEMRKNEGLRIWGCRDIAVTAAEDSRLIIQNAGRGVYVYGSQRTYLERIHTTRILYRAVGGWFDELTLVDSIVDETSLCNYNERLRKNENKRGGWPAAVTGTDDYKGSGIPAKNLVVRRCHFGEGWGEAVGFFSTDGGEVSDCTFVNSSHTVVIYLQQCRNVLVKNNHIILTPHGPRKTRGGKAELAHGIQIAREGTGFKPRAEGLVIEGNYIIGGKNGLQAEWSEFVEDYSGLRVVGNTIVGQDGYAINAPRDSMMRGTAVVEGNVLGKCLIERPDWQMVGNTMLGETAAPCQPHSIGMRFWTDGKGKINYEVTAEGE